MRKAVASTTLNGGLADERGAIYVEGIISVMLLLGIAFGAYELYFYSTTHIGMTHIAREAAKTAAAGAGRVGFSGSFKLDPSIENVKNCMVDSGSRTDCGAMVIASRVWKLVQSTPIYVDKKNIEVIVTSKNEVIASGQTDQVVEITIRAPYLNRTKLISGKMFEVVEKTRVL